MTLNDKTILKIKLLAGTLVLGVLIISAGAIINMATSKDASAQCVELMTYSNLCVRHRDCYWQNWDDGRAKCSSDSYMMEIAEDDNMGCCRLEFYKCP